MNYTIEDNIDFFKELNSAQDDSDDNNVCLISGKPLEEKCIKLECGHRFNYIYIFNDLVQQKKANNYANYKLKTNELKCPYCRNIQSKILPYRKETDCDKIYGINHPNKFCMSNACCSYVFKRGQNKGTTCNKKCDDKFCNAHKKYLIVNTVQT